MEWRAAAWRVNRLRTKASINHGGYESVSDFRCDCSWLRRHWRLGCQATFGSRLDGCGARSRAQYIAVRIRRAHAGLQAAFSRYVAGDREDAAGAEAMLCVHGVQLRLVCQRSGKSLQHAEGQAFHVAAPAHRSEEHTSELQS